MTATSTATFSGVLAERDTAIPVRDGVELMADVFRPDDGRSAPVIMTLGPYAKDVHFRDHPGGAGVYEAMPEQGPHMHWETVNPDWWVPLGYAVVRVDSRGTGRSPGRAPMLVAVEAEDFYDAIEWAGTSRGATARSRSWASRTSPSTPGGSPRCGRRRLAAIVPWEGAVDSIATSNRHGGMFSSGFIGRGPAIAGSARGMPKPPVRRPPLPPEEYGPPYVSSNPELAAIQAPLLSAGNWGGAGLHLRGNIEGFRHAGSSHKLLRVHCRRPHVAVLRPGRAAWSSSVSWSTGCKDVDTGITREPPVKLAIRRWRRPLWRYEHEWPIARTEWTRLHLDAPGRARFRRSSRLGGDGIVRPLPT